MNNGCMYLNGIIKFPMELVHFYNSCSYQQLSYTKSHSLKLHVIIKTMGLHAVDKNLIQVDDEKQ